ncbi:MAG: acyl-protein synthetase [Uliginosibacterium sp.]|nr:acyl-protein synthetase [Uliginosibacterium sp.]
MHAAQETLPFACSQPDKALQLHQRLHALTAHHAAACAPYARMLKALHPAWRRAATLEALPWLPVGLFKRMRLASVAADDIVRELRSSGTTGSTPSTVLLDRATATAQSRALASIVMDFIGRERLPMLVIDQNDLLSNRNALGARAAAVLGFSTFGRQHAYALRPDMSLDLTLIEDFLARHAGQPVLLFGFTAVVWQHLLDALTQAGRTLKFAPGSRLIHGGGWKRLAERQISKAQFKARIGELLGIHAVHDYYGMAEQVGSIFMECEHGRLHVPAYAEAIVRNPLTLRPLPLGESGVIQVLSELPASYPGHSLLTEDVGAILGEDDCPCGRLGRSLCVEGRLPRAELRGCSDTRVA